MRTKFCLVIIVLINCLSTFSQGSNFTIIDGYTNLPLTNYRVSIVHKYSSKQTNYTSDSLGNVYAYGIGNSYRNQILVRETEDGKFKERYYDVSSLKEMKIFLYPTKEYENERFLEEDSIYGKVGKSYYTDCIENNITSYVHDTINSKEQAVYPGGKDAMQGFISKNVQYPVEAIENDTEGRVFLHYIVRPDGAVTHVIVCTSASEILDDEAKRILRATSFDWMPGKLNGQTTGTRLRIPINFSLK